MTGLTERDSLPQPLGNHLVLEVKGDEMPVSKLDVIPATDTKRWHEVLSQADGFDFYHLPEYHLVAEKAGEGTGMLFVYREASRMVAWPFLLRPVETVGGLEVIGKGFHDAISVYGYPGPIGSPGARNDPEFLDRFGSTLQATAKELKLVSMFSRLNPLLENVNLLRDIGTVLGLGKTVAIDLSSSSETQWAHYRKGHRYEIRKARRQGMRAYQDQNWTNFDEFIRLYTATMEKVGADERYFFDRSYFSRLQEALGKRLQLFIAEQEGIICSAALFVYTGDIIQYHLSGSNPDYARLAPSKLVLDEARLWGNTTDARFLHLGGGVGSSEDNLFLFKAGFSPLRYKFFVWNCIVLPEIYFQLVDARRAWLAENGQVLTSTNFFPLYRTG